MSEEKNSRNIIKYAAAGAAVLLCALVFVFFGKRSADITPESESTPLPAATPVPGGMTIEQFIGTLRSSAMGCGISSPERTEDALVYTLQMPDENDTGTLKVFTDSLGRVSSCELRIGYIYVEGHTLSGPALERLNQEYARREKYDKNMITEYLSSVLETCGDDCGIGSVESGTIIKALLNAYETRKDYSKKFGAARFLCSTSYDAENAEFLLEIRFDLSKM